MIAWFLFVPRPSGSPRAQGTLRVCFAKDKWGQLISNIDSYEYVLLPPQGHLLHRRGEGFSQD
jgi:hypothetical protein